MLDLRPNIISKDSISLPSEFRSWILPNVTKLSHMCNDSFYLYIAKDLLVKQYTVGL